MMNENWVPKERQYGLSLDACAEAYKNAVKNRAYRNMKDWEKQLRELDIFYAKEGEP